MDDTYAEHEIKLRVFDDKFNILEEKFNRRMDGLNSKINIMIGIWGALFTSAIIPVLLHHYNLS
jgi:hypothetical protein